MFGVRLAACGDDDAGPTTTAARTTTTAAGPDYTQEIADLTARLEQNLYYRALQ